MGTDVQTSLEYPKQYIPLSKVNSVSLGNLLSNKIKSTPKLKKQNNFVEPASIITSSKELTNSANSSDLSRDFEQKQKFLKASITSQEQKTASKPPVPRMSSKFIDDLK